MKTFIIGITGGVGSLVARSLRDRGDEVAGLVRRHAQIAEVSEYGAEGRVGDLTKLDSQQLADLVGSADTIIYTAGAGGSDLDATTAIDRDGVVKAIAAAHTAGVSRFVLVSVFPDAWRDRDESESFEYYIRMKKEAEIALTKSGLDWVILRPAALQDDPARGTVALGPAETHDEITRADVAETLVALAHEARISQQIFELNSGDTPINEAVSANVRPIAQSTSR